jgi:hypothetical protein
MRKGWLAVRGCNCEPAQAENDHENQIGYATRSLVYDLKQLCICGLQCSKGSSGLPVGKIEVAV